MTLELIEYMKQFVRTPPPGCLHLYTTNAEVDAFNREQLQQLGQLAHRFDCGPRADCRSRWEVDQETVSSRRRGRRSTPAMPVWRRPGCCMVTLDLLCGGARVMLTRN